MIYYHTPNQRALQQVKDILRRTKSLHLFCLLSRFVQSDFQDGTEGDLLPRVFLF